MSDTVIKVENLGKCYRIGVSYPPAKTVFDHVKNLVLSPFSWLISQFRPIREEELLWALRDISFEVQRGDVIGVIGRNGAGKSTLLKILSRITEPSTGQADLCGRIGALLEVGTGMHPELTGRENIYQNGCILGMRRWEIQAKFDEIVAFSGIERFIDTPVKRYSSGMRVRLGFAIAAHLEPEILVVDEVLAVGDSEFQKKCLGKMKDVAGHGRTVLFVSHNMAAVQALCTRAVVLQGGRIVYDGDVATAINHYSQEQEVQAGVELVDRKDRSGAGDLRFVKIEYFDLNRKPLTTLAPGEGLIVRTHIKKNSDRHMDGRISVRIDSRSGPLFLCSSELNSTSNLIFADEGYIECHIPSVPLSSGQYWITLFVEAQGETQDFVENAATLTIDGASYFGFGRDAPAGHEGRYVLVKHHFTQNEQEAVTC